MKKAARRNPFDWKTRNWRLRPQLLIDGIERPRKSPRTAALL